MDNKRKEKGDGSSRWGLVAAVGGAIAASICCVGPLLLLVVGAGGAWAGSLAVFAKYRPLFIGIAAVSLGLSFYRVYRKPAALACGSNGECGDGKNRKIQRIVLWIVTIFVAGVIAVPYLVPGVMAGKQAAPPVEGKTVLLKMENFSCPSCASVVKKDLKDLKGVEAVNVTYDPPEARVTYNPALLSVQKIMNETARIGYPSTLKSKGR